MCHSKIVLSLSMIAILLHMAKTSLRKGPHQKFNHGHHSGRNVVEVFGGVPRILVVTVGQVQGLAKRLAVVRIRPAFRAVEITCRDESMSRKIFYNSLATLWQIAGGRWATICMLCIFLSYTFISWALKAAKRKGI